MNGPYRRYAPIDRLDGPSDAPDAGYDCICPGDGCCKCFSNTDLCDCEAPEVEA